MTGWARHKCKKKGTEMWDNIFLVNGTYCNSTDSPLSNLQQGQIPIGRGRKPRSVFIMVFLLSTMLNLECSI